MNGSCFTAAIREYVPIRRRVVRTRIVAAVSAPETGLLPLPSRSAILQGLDVRLSQTMTKSAARPALWLMDRIRRHRLIAIATRSALPPPLSLSLSAVRSLEKHWPRASAVRCGSTYPAKIGRRQDRENRVPTCRSSIVKFPDFSSHGMTVSLTLSKR